MNLLTGFFGALSTFFQILNMFGGVISGIWLLILGEWWALGIGFLGLMLSHFLISVTLIPNIALGAGVQSAAAKGSKTGIFLFGLLSQTYIAFVMAVWSIGVLMIFTSNATAQTWTPLLIWSYGVAMGPWAYLASKDVQAGAGDGSVQATFFGQLAFVVVVLGGVFTGATYYTLAWVFGGVMLINVALAVLVTMANADELIILATMNKYGADS